MRTGDIPLDHFGLRQVVHLQISLGRAKCLPTLQHWAFQPTKLTGKITEWVKGEVMTKYLALGLVVVVGIVCASGCEQPADAGVNVFTSVTNDACSGPPVTVPPVQPQADCHASYGCHATFVRQRTVIRDRGCHGRTMLRSRTVIRQRAPLGWRLRTLHDTRLANVGCH